MPCCRSDGYSLASARTGSILVTRRAGRKLALRYSREYEREADLLGAHIMARAGYDPLQMANMFRTIQQLGGQGPEFLSDHPDPGDRYAAIIREAGSLRVAGAANTGRAFDSVRSRLSQMPPAPTPQRVARR